MPPVREEKNTLTFKGFELSYSSQGFNLIEKMLPYDQLNQLGLVKFR